MIVSAWFLRVVLQVRNWVLPVLKNIDTGTGSPIHDLLGPTSPRTCFGDPEYNYYSIMLPKQAVLVPQALPLKPKMPKALECKGLAPRAEGCRSQR